MAPKHKIIDTHSHLYTTQFDSDRETVIEEAKKAGISAILLPNINEISAPHMFQLCSRYPNFCYPMAGLHPTDVRLNYLQQFKEIEKQLSDPRIIAIGETGIDLYWDKSTLAEQKLAFEFQLNLAYDRNLPIVIHARKSFDVIFEIIKKQHGRIPKGVFHCFGGNINDAKKVLDLDMYFGIGGVVTFHNSGLQEVVAQLPIEKIVVETDSPYLAPSPHRGKRNDTSYIIYVLQKIAEIKNMTFEETSAIIYKNSVNLFFIDNQ